MPEIRIAVSLTEENPGPLDSVEPLVDYWEIRMDLVGPRWPELAAKLKKPWIACNRSPQEGGRGQSEEKIRVNELLRGVEAGAAIVDIELSSAALENVVSRVKKRAQCLISYHNVDETPDLAALMQIVRRQAEAGADIVKVVTHAQSLRDNLCLLELVRLNPKTRVISFAMGDQGRISRILSPLAGAFITFASLETGKESAPGQIEVGEMRRIYQLVQNSRWD
ncbi:MAG TPA: type I 3-dehydroquinate dehydratase [Dehalococcoidales bacterium]|nr:type I 3-dehydroquinate dehydratase [Dehalococcoidales bacterium]